MADRIRLVGAERCVMTTDFGQIQNPSAPEGLYEFIGRMRAEGISKEEIRLMVRKNPVELLGR